MPDNVKYTSQYSGSQIDDAITKVGMIANYVVEYQKNTVADTWGYLKFDNNIAVCWGFFNVTPTVPSNTSGQYSDEISITTPFRMYNMVFSGLSDNLHMVCNPGGGYDDNCIRFRLWRHDGVQASQKLVRIILFGLY